MVDLGIGRGEELLEDEREDTQITLGTGKLLLMFFGLVLMCSFFFTIGYMLGRSNSAGAKTEVTGAAPTGGTSAGKPSAVDKMASAPASPTVAPQPTPQYATSTASTAIPRQMVAAPTPAPSPEVKVAGSGSYTVQIAAVSKQEDAQSLVSALQRKQYPVFLTTGAGDTLFHVQVGPFSDPQDAEIMRARLAAEGYNAIVKRYQNAASF